MSAPRRPAGEGAKGKCHGGAAAPRHCKAGKVRCVSQARSSGSTTPRVTDSSNAKVAATCSSTSRRSRATGSGRSKRARQSSSRSSMALRARRPVTSPNPNKSRTGPGGRRALPASGRFHPPHPASLSSTLQPPHRKVHFPVFHGYAERDLRTAVFAQLRDLVLHERGKLVKRHHIVTHLAPRVHQRVVERVELVH